MRARKTSSSVGCAVRRRDDVEAGVAEVADPAGERPVAAAAPVTVTTAPSTSPPMRAAAVAASVADPNASVTRSPASDSLSAGAVSSAMTRAVVHDHDALGELVGLVEVVRGEEDRRAGRPAQVDDVLPEVGAAVRVEAGRRLVEEQQLGAVDEPERDVEPALLAARERLHLPVRDLVELERLDELGGPRAGSRDGPVP